jgi:hypothetical protein
MVNIMNWLTRDEIRSVVGTALKEIADYDKEFECFDFLKFHLYHKSVFINKIATLLAQRGFSVTLSTQKLEDFKIIKDLIDYIDREQV